jgi:hypothetical protein
LTTGDIAAHFVNVSQSLSDQRYLVVAMPDLNQ